MRHARPQSALLLAVAVIAIAILWRIAPHTPNLSPVAATAMFVSFLTGRALYGAGAALLVLAVSDASLGGYDPLVMAAVWGSLALPALFAGMIPRRRPTMLPAALGFALVSAVLFFLVTNAAVFAASDVYARSLNGLLTCYAAALPFFRATLVGDLVWSGVFFGGYALAFHPQRKERFAP